MSKKNISNALIALQNNNLFLAEKLARHVIEEQGFMVPEAVHILASIALLNGKSATAIALIGRILQQKTIEWSYHLEGRIYQTLGRALLVEQKYDAARSAFSIAVTLFPEEAASHAGLGESYLFLENPQKAIRYLKKATLLAPNQAALWGLLAQAYRKAKLIHQELSSWQRVLALAPQDGAAYANYGGALFTCGRWEEAASVLEKSLESGSLTAQTLNNMGLVRSAQGYMQEACVFFERALYQLPEDHDIIVNWSAALYDMGESDGALSVLSRVKETTKKLPSKIYFNYAALFLEKGMWEKGWKAFEERRFILPECITKPYPHLPSWQGDEGDEPIILYAEQGLGDAVQFLRFLPHVVARRPVRLHISSDLMFLVDKLMYLPKERILPYEGFAAAQQSLLSIPYLLKMNEEISSKPYFLTSRKPETGLVGVCWAGNGSYAFNRRRSIPVELLEPLKHVLGVHFLSLQQNAVVPDWMEKTSLNSLEELSSAIERCDIVISVDTLVAHIAGAYGCPLWLLNRKGGDWRWKGGHWYQNVRQFQATKARPSHESWPEVINNVVMALCEIF